MAAYVLNDNDRRLLEETMREVKQWRQERAKETQGSFPDAGPQIYVAKVPSGGIPGMTFLDYNTGTGTSGGEETPYQPGEAECQLFVMQLDDMGSPLLWPSGKTRVVYNLSEYPVESQFAIVHKTYGLWVVDQTGRATAGTGTGTGTGVGSVCTPFTTIRVKSMSLAVNNTKLRIEREIEKQLSNGCNTITPISPLLLDICCEVDTGTGSGGVSPGTGTGETGDCGLPAGAMYQLDFSGESIGSETVGCESDAPELNKVHLLEQDVQEGFCLYGGYFAICGNGTAFALYKSGNTFTLYYEDETEILWSALGPWDGISDLTLNRVGGATGTLFNNWPATATIEKI